jgi:hypothetical protein
MHMTYFFLLLLIVLSAASLVPVIRVCVLL